MLVVEDEEWLAECVRDILGIRGWEVDLAATVPDGCAALRRDNYDLVVSDVLLPDGGAHRLLSSLREFRHRPPVLLITGAPDDTVWAGLLSMGASECLSKPFGIVDLLAAADRTLAS